MPEEEEEQEVEEQGAITQPLGPADEPEEEAAEPTEESPSSDNPHAGYTGGSGEHGVG